MTDYMRQCSRCCAVTETTNSLCDLCAGKQADVSRRYRTQRWRVMSERVRREHARCQRCKERESTETHHIVKALDDPEKFFDPWNLMAVCRECHNALDDT